MEELRSLDLFSGIGGFTLGLERAGVKTVAFCESDPSCREVLNEHWPNIPIIEDIHYISRGTMGQKNIKWLKEQGVNCVHGGYPCLGHSTAGSKKGFKNEQSKLWEEQLRIVRELRPKYCIIENSHNLRSTGLAELLEAYNAERYDAEWSIISGYSVGAPHQRERIYIVFWRRDIPYCNPFRSWHADPEKKKATSGWWAERRFKRAPVFKQVSKIKPRVLSFDDGLSKELVKSEEEKIKMIGNSLVPQIPELIGRALVEHEKTTMGDM